MLQALGYDAVAWMWAANQVRGGVGHELLVAISDGDNRELRLLLEEPETHEAFCDEGCFAAFMIACALHGDRGCWNEIKSHGYGLDTLFNEPVFDDTGAFVGMYSKKTRVGDWMGAWRSQDRIVELADEMDWAIFSIEGDCRPKIGCDWRLSGIHEEKGWVGLWKRQYIRVMEDKRRRDNDDEWTIKRAVKIPFVLFAMDEWAARSEEKGESRARDRTLLRLDEMIMTWAEQAYWPDTGADLWDRFVETPPYVDTGGIDTEKAKRTLLRVGDLLADAAPRKRLDLVEDIDNLGWMIQNDRQVSAAALIEMGARLVDGKRDIGEVILRMAILGKNEHVDPALWVSWKKRALSEGSQAWDRLPEFIKSNPIGKARQRANKEPAFREMVEMALQTQVREQAKPAARF